MLGLRGGKIGMNPQPVSGQQVRNLGDGQSQLSALHVHVHLGASQIKAGAVRAHPDST